MHATLRFMLAAGCLALALPAAAQDRVGLRGGDHPGFGRLVFDWPRNVGYLAEEAPGEVLAHLHGFLSHL